MENGRVAAWLNGRVPNGFWELPANRLSYLKWLGDRLGYRKPDDWYSIKRIHFQRNRGGGLLTTYYSDSPQMAVRELMPNRQWHTWLFSRTTNGYWQSIENRRAFMAWLEKKLEIEKKEDWYRVTKKDFVEHGGMGLLGNYYDWCVATAIKEYKPRILLEEWRFQTAPQGFWKSPTNRTRYMDWLTLQLKIRTPELWYSVTAEQVRQHHGITLLTLCGGSVYRMASEYLPDFNWKPWLFPITPTRYWDCVDNRQAYLKWLGAEFGFRKPKDWYQLRELHFRRTGGTQLYSKYYGFSLIEAARERYPNFNWNPVRFQESNADKYEIAG